MNIIAVDRVSVNIETDFVQRVVIRLNHFFSENQNDKKTFETKNFVEPERW